jgi:hypothetical protein
LVGSPTFRMETFHFDATYPSLKYCYFYTDVFDVKIVEHYLPKNMLFLVRVVYENRIGCLGLEQT